MTVHTVHASGCRTCMPKPAVLGMKVNGCSQTWLGAAEKRKRYDEEEEEEEDEEEGDDEDDE